MPPSDSGKLFRLAIVALVKNEGRYLPEWLAYHIRLGVEHFYIFDNGSTDDSRAALERFINYGYVTRIDWPVFPGQDDAYAYAARVFGPLAEWLAFIDADEFFVLKQHDSLPALLAELDADQLLVFWKLFGHSGHRERPDGLAITSYVHCARELSTVTKAIVRSECIQYPYIHNCVTTSGHTVNDAGDPLRETWTHPREQRSEQLVRVNHYFTRSYEDYAAKIERGQADARDLKRLEPFERFDYAEEDRLAAEHGPEVEHWLRKFDALPLQPHRYGAATAIGCLSEPRNFKLYAQDAAEKVVASLPDARATLDHFRFGVVATFEDLTAAPQLTAIVGERLRDWAAETHGEIEAQLGDFEFRNGDAVASEGRFEFEAATEDPQVVAKVTGDAPLGYHWIASVLVTEADSETDVFAFGADPHGEEIYEWRRLQLRPGLSLVLVMINDTPLRLTTGRLDPGSAPGRYEVWDVALVRSR
jgi:glycosyltransferase involved in cell wall biosynthesis